MGCDIHLFVEKRLPQVNGLPLMFGRRTRTTHQNVPPSITTSASITVICVRRLRTKTAPVRAMPFAKLKEFGKEIIFRCENIAIKTTREPK